MLLETEYLSCISEINPNFEKIIAFHNLKELINLYSESFRIYHNLDHIEHGYTLLEEVKNLCDDYFLVLYAWFYHDCIYVPNAKNINEIISADRAVFDGSRLGFGIDAVRKIRNLVMATEHVKPMVNTNDEKIIHDVDLAILGANPDDYDSYSSDIRKEYCIFPWNQYRDGRLFAMNTFLKLDQIYFTDYFKDLFEKRARANIKREMKAIREIG